MQFYCLKNFITCGNVGSVVECSPATRAARVRFPDVAITFIIIIYIDLQCWSEVWHIWILLLKLSLAIFVDPKNTLLILTSHESYKIIDFCCINTFYSVFP